MVHPLDWLVVLLYFAFIIGVGLRTGRDNRGIEDYFLAKRSMPWWAIGLSVMATQASAITLVGTTGQGYVDGMRFIQIYFGLPIAMVILCMTLVPFFYRARVYTAYEFLEQRFDGKTRSLTSFLFLLSRGLSDAVVIYAPSVVLSIVFGMDEKVLILAIGLGATIYTAFGGMRAVMWTEVWQMLIIFLGMVFCLGSVVVGLPDSLSLGSALRIVGTTGRLATVDFNPDPRVTYTFWTGLVGGIFLMLSYFGCDQSQVQRYLTGSSLAQSRMSLLFNALLKIPMQFIILLTGAMLFVFYQFEKPPVVFNRVELAKLEASSHAGQYRELARQYDEAFEERRQAAETLAAADGPSEAIAQTEFLAADVKLGRARRDVGELIAEMNGAPFNDTNYVFPTFVLTYLPAGIVGLILVAIFAAAMSTVESELNSLSTATIVDFYKRYVTTSAPDQHYVVAGRIATVVWGGFATFGALYMGRLGSAIEAVNRIGSFFYGSILGVFVLAIATRRATGRGAFWGLAAGMAAVYLTSEYSEISYLYYNIVGCVVVVIVGYLISLSSPEKRA
ncbi:MAG TPA: sodium:solute symporter [Vicinamibacteria bacterium]|jgi:Na+/proline symporter